MNEFYFGSHIKYDNNLLEGASNVLNAGGNLVQIFLTLPGAKSTKERTVEELDKFKKFLIKNKMKAVVHSSYIHNLAKNWDKYSWWIRNLELEIKYANYIDAIGVVIHFGKQMDLSLQEAYNNMYTSLIYLYNRTKNFGNSLILLETSTGQGSELCSKLKDLAYFFRKFSKNENKDIRKKFKLCVDTCHIFAAGYNIKNKTNINLYLETFEEIIGLKHVKLIHLNDCMVKQGEQVDRHQNIGQGFIGLQGLTYWFKYFAKLNVPIILETPNQGYKMEIKMMKDLITSQNK